MRDLLRGVERDFSGEARPIVAAGVERLIDYQDIDYADEFLARLSAFARSSDDTATAPTGCLPKRRASSRSPWPTRTPSAWPTSRSASSRFARVRAEAQIERRPDSRDRRIPSSPHAGDRRHAAGAARDAGSCARPGRAACSSALTRKGKIVKTTSVSGFLLLYLLSKLRPLRRRSLRFAAGEAALASWLDLVAETARTDYALALQVARMRSLVKGYGDTHERGRAKFGQAGGAASAAARAQRSSRRTARKA